MSTIPAGAAVIATAVAGGLVALQAPINGQLGRELGSLQAAAVSFAIGTVLLTAIVLLAAGGFGGVGTSLREISSPVYLLGGVLGAGYVTTVLICVPSLGASGVTAATFAGQLLISLVVDRYGWLGVEQAPVTATRLLGVALLVAGVLLVVRK